MPIFYISFATNLAFLGATVVEANDAAHALTVATERGLNPGGQAAIVEVPREAESEPDLLAIRDRLANKAEMLAQGGTRHGDLPEEMQSRFDAAAERVCQECNPAPGRK